MENDYNRIAPIYQLLSRICFGRSIINSQIWLLHYVLPESKVLIVGGGSGEILDKLVLIEPAGLDITYLEASLNMIQLARKKNRGNNQLVFIHERVEEFHTEKKFDFIITPFFFDNFGIEKIESIVQKLDRMLIRDGKWLFADFYADADRSPRWQKTLLKIMYWFFRITCKIGSDSLINPAPVFTRYGYEQLSTRNAYRGFIKSIVYQKRIRAEG